VVNLNYFMNKPEQEQLSDSAMAHSLKELCELKIKTRIFKNMNKLQRSSDNNVKS
jgi:hypothetical protein